MHTGLIATTVINIILERPIGHIKDIIYDHKYNIKNNKQNHSKLVERILTTLHTFDFEEFEILNHENNCSKEQY